MSISWTKPRRNSFRCSKVLPLKSLAESRQVGQRVARGGLQIYGLEVDAFQIGETGFDILPADANPPQALVHEVPVGRRGEVQEPIGLGLEAGELRLELANLLPRVRRLGQNLLGDELPQEGLATTGQVLVQPPEIRPSDRR